MVIFPCAVQYILIACLFYTCINGSVCLSLSCPYLAPPLSPLVTTSLLSISESVSVLLYTFICFIFRFHCKWQYTVFVFLCLTYFTKPNTL